MNVKKVQSIWSYVYRIIDKKLTCDQVILNMVTDNPNWPQNVIVLLAKYYIYRSRCLNERISPIACKNFIENYKEIEEQIAIRVGKHDRHTTKWNNVKL